VNAAGPRSIDSSHEQVEAHLLEWLSDLLVGARQLDQVADEL